MKNKILYILFVVALLAVGCKEKIVPEEPIIETEPFDGGKVMLAAGTTENSVSTRADARTYYMPAAHRFVAKMYFKTNASGVFYDTLRYHTAWLKVDGEGAGNSLYWKNTYPTTAEHEDTYHNDEFAPTFYWQNRKEHAFLAWTDLNHATTITGSVLHFNENNPTYYQHHSGIKEWAWTPKNYMVYNLATPFSSLGDLRNAAADPAPTALNSLTTDEEQTAQKAYAESLGERPSRSKWYYVDGRELYCTIDRPADYYSDYIPIDATHRKSQWYVMTIYDITQKIEYTGETTNTRTYYYGTVVVDADDKIVAVKVNDGDKFYECDEDGYVTCPAKYVFCYQVYETNESRERIDEYPALAFDLSKGEKDSMSKQPDILQALTIDQIPKSAVMEANRVHLFFKHQFAQVQVNLKNAVDNSVQITEDQIRKVELLGVTNTGYMFTSMNPDGTIHVPAGFKSSTFKEVVATDFTDAQLEVNPYGTSFDMFERTVPDDEKELNKIVKSYECITFGRLQAIRITWQETDAEGGVEHVTTYRVPEKNEMNQPLRLLEQGTKYIWNMELRRGTLAVVRTEIIPWEENPEEYNVDGSIVTTPSNQ